MNYKEMITSPYHGIIEEICIQSNSRIYEWESLFIVRTDEDTIKTVATGMSGSVHSLEVKIGEEVIPGMVLAYIEEDLVVSGSD
ncbi:hypothetical protein MUO14_18340 [Halobacillus shinanisalinarum]|uniref:Lipoyl-binding domain-containing protein n=1 Tax=Halobacillus shinanisalinarum TaxID=2932258 RepID=A0ABY4GWH4_9BACI|nr:hypothetical protein [Halobacillus shinanisalinarum]UOQ92404.1 hypothetical protein MUO14_18340 [Halobacillus shinanisalinarum]